MVYSPGREAGSCKEDSNGRHSHACTPVRLSARVCGAGVYGPKHDIRSVTSDDMLSVYKVNCIGPLLVVQGLLNAGLIGGFGGKTCIANVSSKVWLKRGTGRGGVSCMGRGCRSGAEARRGQCAGSP